MDNLVIEHGIDGGIRTKFQRNGMAMMLTIEPVKSRSEDFPYGNVFKIEATLGGVNLPFPILLHTGDELETVRTHYTTMYKDVLPLENFELFRAMAMDGTLPEDAWANVNIYESGWLGKAEPLGGYVVNYESVMEIQF